MSHVLSSSLLLCKNHNNNNAHKQEKKELSESFKHVAHTRPDARLPTATHTQTLSFMAMWCAAANSQKIALTFVKEYMNELQLLLSFLWCAFESEWMEKKRSTAL